MNPIDQLKDEHRAVRTALAILQEVAAAMLRRDPRMSTGQIDELLGFFRIFVDRCHHAKEEKLLFPALEEVGIGRQGGPIGVMLAEHEQGRSAIRGMSEAMSRYRNGEPGAGASFADHARAYRELLDRHIEKENSILFALAERYLTEEKKNELAWGFDNRENEEIGPGRHQAFHLMLDRLAGRWLGKNDSRNARGRGCLCGNPYC